MFLETWTSGVALKSADATNKNWSRSIPYSKEYVRNTVGVVENICVSTNRGSSQQLHYC